MGFAWVILDATLSNTGVTLGPPLKVDVDLTQIEVETIFCLANLHSGMENKIVFLMCLGFFIGSIGVSSYTKSPANKVLWGLYGAAFLGLVISGMQIWEEWRS